MFPKNFTLEELLHSDKAISKRIENFPSWDQMENIQILGNELQKVRDFLGTPMNISSGFRCAELNKAVGGSSTSSHAQGLAADFTSPWYGSPKEICDAIAASGLQFDQIIDEGTWVHIGFRQPYRRQYLKADFSTGQTSYMPVNWEV